MTSNPAPVPAAAPADALRAADAVLPAGTVDTVVIGGGPAGLNGALMLARSRRSVVVVDSGEPRNAPAEGVHGLFGHDGTPPADLLERGRDEVRRYGGTIVTGRVVDAVADGPGEYAGPAGVSPGEEPTGGRAAGAVPADPRFTVTLADGGTLRARRLLVATGLRDVLPDIPGLARHWGRRVVHCPYCHGWEVRDEAIGVVATGAPSVHHALLFRQLTDDLVYFANGLPLDDDTRARFAARGIRVVDTPVDRVLAADDGGISRVVAADGHVVPRTVLAVATVLEANTAGLERLGLPLEELPDGAGRRFASGPAGATDVPGVWVAGNATDLAAQVGASAAAGALAGARINADLAQADADAALATARPAA